MSARHKEICTAVNLENRSTVHRKKKRENRSTVRGRHTPKTECCVEGRITWGAGGMFRKLDSVTM
jgi:hypothetical protein